MTSEPPAESRLTRITQVVFPGTTNHHGTLFGGEVLSMMDSAAFIAATRHCRMKVVTRLMETTEFAQPIPAGSIVELTAWVTGVGRTSMRVRVEVVTEDMYSPARSVACSGEFVLVALGSDGQPSPVPSLSTATLADGDAGF
ncbi:acyl-CoA thioesterase [Deinococcus radiophilus]|uniref:Acyl-CoA thioesterase n=1 Tax=Deinococcus radiophilus TaxID=32062 RepID=A0A431VS88_9DEIO|nr:acyl-CoA thioesterase [Deinococcus radiophilus]RTR26102.1 acyl-CoA thioesterase [Deinococcus radiophilus]UFA51580.1 acyl-CoA thioesterase [Deinococcus radiophilus]